MKRKLEFFVNHLPKLGLGLGESSIKFDNLYPILLIIGLVNKILIMVKMQIQLKLVMIDILYNF